MYDYFSTDGKHSIGPWVEIKWSTQEGCWVAWNGFLECHLGQACKKLVVRGNIYDNSELRP